MTAPLLPPGPAPATASAPTTAPDFAVRPDQPSFDRVLDRAERGRRTEHAHRRDRRGRVDEHDDAPSSDTADARRAEAPRSTRSDRADGVRLDDEAHIDDGARLDDEAHIDDEAVDEVVVDPVADADVTEDAGGVGSARADERRDAGELMVAGAVELAITTAAPVRSPGDAGTSDAAPEDLATVLDLTVDAAPGEAGEPAGGGEVPTELVKIEGAAADAAQSAEAATGPALGTTDQTTMAGDAAPSGVIVDDAGSTQVVAEADGGAPPDDAAVSDGGEAPADDGASMADAGGDAPLPDEGTPAPAPPPARGTDAPGATTAAPAREAATQNAAGGARMAEPGPAVEAPMASPSAPAGNAAATPSGPAAPSPSTMASTVQRIIEVVEEIARQTPPRSMTVELGELDGVRVQVSMESSGVRLRFLDELAPDQRRMLERELARSLAERGFDLADGGTDGRRQTSREHDEPRWAPLESGRILRPVAAGAATTSTSTAGRGVRL